MRFLFIVRQKKNVDTFERVVSLLLGAGHEVRLAIQEPLDQARREAVARRFAHREFQLVSCPEGRGDEWRASAPLVRAARDWAQYLRPPYRDASKLRARAAHRLIKELGLDRDADDATVPDALQGVRIRRTLEFVERSIPSDGLHEEFIGRQAPDVVLVTPGLHFGSAQTDFVKSARALGIPVWMLLFSWDNLSTKGALHEAPDAMFVWNERQRREAVELHDYPSSRVVVTGAPRFDEFFTLQNVVPRDEFFRPLGLDPALPTLLYVCSSRFIAERELPFIEGWLGALRESASPDLRRCNVIVRPHPDLALLDDSSPSETIVWRSLPQASGFVQRPFADPRALVLRTTYRTPQAFFECLYHASAVVGLNTSAELEAGIVGRPVFTLISHEAGADGQTNTLHFDYLLREHGGFVVSATGMTAHVAQVAEVLRSPVDTATIRTFIDSFLRPAGGPVSELLARRLIEEAESVVRLRLDSASVALKPDSSSVRPPPDSTSDDDVGVPEEARKKVRLGYPGSTVRIIATPETRPTRRKGVLELDQDVVDWLDAHVHPGDVVYDIGAGVGPYSLVVAMHRGALSVAFEAGFASFKRLCDNLLLNGCYRSVIPLPIALAERAGLLELEYRGEAGGHGYSLRPREWRTRRDAIEAQYSQPVCADRLDDVIERHKLPRPQVVRIALRRGAGAVSRGADATLRDPRLRSVLISAKGDEEADDVVRTLSAYGFAASVIHGEGGNRTVILIRSAVQEGLTRAVGGLLRRMGGGRGATRPLHGPKS